MVIMPATVFNREPSAVKRQVFASDEPVLVTDRDEPSLVVMRYTDYVELKRQAAIPDLADWLQLDAEIDVEIPVMGFGLRPVDL